DLNMLTIRDSELTADEAEIDVSGVRNLYLENVNFKVPSGKEVWKIEPDSNENLFINGKSMLLPKK
ncbi:MAG: hypothetical protein II910_04975, partial [Prevotella sp.]|nr:hypothetical protein [Prevotella sp.]